MAKKTKCVPMSSAKAHRVVKTLAKKPVAKATRKPAAKKPSVKAATKAKASSKKVEVAKTPTKSGKKGTNKRSPASKDTVCANEEGAERIIVETRYCAIDPQTTLEYGGWSADQGYSNNSGASGACPELDELHTGFKLNALLLKDGHKTTASKKALANTPSSSSSSSSAASPAKSTGSKSSKTATKSPAKSKEAASKAKVTPKKEVKKSDEKPKRRRRRSVEYPEFDESKYTDTNLTWRTKSVSTALAKRKPKADDRTTWFPKKSGAVTLTRAQVAAGGRKKKIGRPTKAMVAEREARLWKNSKEDSNSENDSIEGDYNYKNYVLRFVFFQLAPRSTRDIWDLSEDDLPKSWWLCDAGKPTSNADFPFQLQFSGHIKNAKRMDALLKATLDEKKTAGELMHYCIMETYTPNKCKI